MSGWPHSLEERFHARLVDLGLDGPDDRLLVATSGGLDSTVLLYLLRHREGLAGRIVVAHFDHAMRDGSDADARWVGGLCRAWGVPLEAGRADHPLRGEADARTARYRFLRGAARRVGATAILTAHHADDQAETVLFRVLRGTGLRGLGGMRDRAGLVARPLLPFWRAELASFARSAGLAWREDPTNRTLSPRRNRIRNVFLPALDRDIAPGARQSLVRLARIAADAERIIDLAAEPLLRAAVVSGEGGIQLARAPFREYHPPLAARVLRDVLHGAGIALSAVGTRLALQFITDARSGARHPLPGGAALVAEFDRVRVVVPTDVPDDVEVVIPGGGTGEGVARLGGRAFTVRWTVEPAAGDSADQAGWRAAFDVGQARFPLHVRGWQPGDRIRLAAGTKRLKKLFGERRVPVSDRSRVPVVADADGAILLVGGLARSESHCVAPGADALHLTIFHG
jgi:tRNA(Ile)-lysidine synthase